MTDSKNSTELLSYIGMEITALQKQGYSPADTKHLVIGQLMEMIMKTLAVKENKEYDYYSLLPLFISVKFLIDIEIHEKSEASYIPQVAEDLEKLELISEYLERRISIIKETRDREED